MKALWAVEPFHQNKSQIKNAYKLIKEVCGNEEIEVGFVVTRTENELNLAYEIPKKDRFSEYPQQLIKKKLANAGIPTKLLNINVIDYPTYSKSKAAMRLLKIGKDRKCDICIIYSQGGSKLKKMFLGSFAESAVHFSEIKLLVINPYSKLSGKIKTVMFCHEPSKKSSEALNEMIKFCKQLKAKLVIFHAAHFWYETPESEMDEEVEAYKNSVKKWQKEIEYNCAKSQVKCEFQITPEFAMVSELAIKTAKKVGADLISVLAKSTSTTALMGGSVTRQLLRGSDLPVLVLR
ncbi:MAG: universal stress protein [Bdellovibrionaceae bacterium]|nr:universal stress protein [Pseudobdellovibrionaceae bacterium]